jgi:hypothetical protein
MSGSKTINQQHFSYLLDQMCLNSTRHVMIECYIECYIILDVYFVKFYQVNYLGFHVIIIYCHQ